MNHVFSLSEILAHQTSKRKFSSLMNGTKELIKDEDSPFVRSKDFFTPFTHPSKSFTVVDPHLFTSKKGGQFGNDSLLAENIKYDHFNDNLFKQTLKGLLLYTDWIYSIYKNTNWELPRVYFIGGPVANIGGQGRIYKEKTMAVLSLMFQKKVLDLKDLKTPSSKSIRFFIELLEKDKIYLAQVKNYSDVDVDKKSENYKSFINKENTRIRNTILKSYDFFLNDKYNVDINKIAINNVENYFR